MWSSPFPNFDQPAGNSFSFQSIWKIRNSRLFHLSEDHQCWVNLWNIGVWRHTTYTSEQALIIRLYLRRVFSIISFFSFIRSVQDDLPQIFIEPIGFTVENILKDIILRHCCGLGLCIKCLAKWAVKESKFLLFTTFLRYILEVLFHFFKEFFGYFQRKSHRRICTLSCK